MALTPRAKRFGKAKGSIALERLTRRTQFRQRKQLSDQALTQAGFNSSTGQSTEDPNAARDKELSDLRFEVNKQNLTNAKLASDRTFQDFTEDNDLGHLNRLINENSEIRKIWGGDRNLVHLAKLDEHQEVRIANAIKKAQLEGKRIQSELENEEVDPQAMAARHFNMIFQNADGTTEAVPVDAATFINSTGYPTRLNKKNREAYDFWLTRGIKSRQAFISQQRQTVGLASDQEKLAQQEGVTEAQPAKLTSEQELREAKVGTEQAKETRAGLIAGATPEQLSRAKTQAAANLRQTNAQVDKILAGTDKILADTKSTDKEISRANLTRKMFDPEQDFTLEDEAAFTDTFKGRGEAQKARLEMSKTLLKKNGFLDSPVDRSKLSPRMERDLTRVLAASSIDDKVLSDHAELLDLGTKALKVTEQSLGPVDVKWDNLWKRWGKESTLEATAALKQYNVIKLKILSGAAVSDGEFTRVSEAMGVPEDNLRSITQSLVLSMGSSLKKLDVLRSKDPIAFHALFGNTYNNISKAVEIGRNSLATKTEFEGSMLVEPEGDSGSDSDILAGMPKPKANSKLSLLK